MHRGRTKESDRKEKRKKRELRVNKIYRKKKKKRVGKDIQIPK